MYKVTFILKQHTLLIHFPHEQDGATLRAIEVKPKFDRFIFESIAEFIIVHTIVILFIANLQYAR